MGTDDHKKKPKKKSFLFLQETLKRAALGGPKRTVLRQNGNDQTKARYIRIYIEIYMCKYILCMFFLYY